MTGISHLFCTVFAVLLTAGCIASPFGAVGDGMVSATGTVTYIGLEGGFYGLITENGEQYLLVDLPDELAADGLPVRFTGEVETDIVTFQQWGTTDRTLADQRRDRNETETALNLTEALFVLHEPMDGDLSGTILLCETNTSGYVCRSIREGDGLNTSWVMALADMTGICPAPDAVSRNRAASYVTDLTEYRDYAGENLTIIRAAQGPCPNSPAYT